MKKFAEIIAGLVLLTSWLAGIALASGFWSTALAIFFAPWAWYLVVEKFLMSIGWL